MPANCETMHLWIAEIIYKSYKWCRHHRQSIRMVYVLTSEPYSNHYHQRQTISISTTGVRRASRVGPWTHLVQHIHCCPWPPPSPRKYQLLNVYIYMFHWICEGLRYGQTCEDGLSPEIHIKRGVRQGCVLSPCLFNLFTETSLEQLIPTKA